MPIATANDSTCVTTAPFTVKGLHNCQSLACVPSHQLFTMDIEDAGTEGADTWGADTGGADSGGFTFGGAGFGVPVLGLLLLGVLMLGVLALGVLWARNV
ncbi:unnamed protein product [Closterium sp. NIES-54]